MDGNAGTRGAFREYSHFDGSSRLPNFIRAASLLLGLPTPTMPCMDAKPIATVPFIDGTTRDVYFDLDGRQFLQDDDGTPIYGEWILIDEPEVIEPGRPT